MKNTPIYFHGQPGAMSEVTLAGVKLGDVRAPNQASAQDTLIGFSLGAHAALVQAATFGAKSVHLIAPAAPLSLGNFLPEMAGEPVFRAGLKGRLAALTRVQSIMAQIAPNLLIRAMLKSAALTDRDIFKDPQNHAQFKHILRHSLRQNRAAYVGAIASYLRDWANILPQVDAPVTIWHGTADTWAPITMSQALRDQLPNATLNILPDLGHYAALAHALPRALPRAIKSD